ncbi:MAG: primosomal protein N' [Candidatus Margulisiibacteriota bacterium]
MAFPMYAQVILSTVSSFFDKPFTYSVPEELAAYAKIGMQVKVPFGKRAAIGYIISVSDKPEEGISGIKDIIEIRGEIPFFSGQNVKTALWLSKYYVSYVGSALKAVLPPGVSGFERPGGKKRIVLQESGQNLKAPQLSAEPIGVVAELLSLTKAGTFTGALVYKKDSVPSEQTYLMLARQLLSLGKGLILLYPDAEYLNPASKLFTAEFGTAAAVLHSSLSEKERLAEWLRIYSGEARIVLGTRAAVFAPVKDLGMIIIDREEGYAYKQETSPKYNAGEAALFIGRQTNVPVVFFSSCPTLETFYRAKSGKFRMISIHKDISDQKTLLEIVDMNKEKKSSGGIFSQKLLNNLEDVLSRKGKVLLLAGRKGHSTFLYCADCGTSVNCPNCSVPLVYSMEEKKVLCGRCGFSVGTSIVCSNCLGHRIKYAGSGTQKVETELKRLFPFAKTLRLDRDSVSKGQIGDAVVDVFSKGQANVIIGTRLAAKTVDFVDFDLIGVISADASLNSTNFRSTEETFRMLSELAQPVPAGKAPKKVVIQTYKPDHYTLHFAQTLDFEGFYQKEIEQRKASGDPPFGSLINITVSGRDNAAAEGAADKIAQRLQDFSGTKILGPSQSTVAKVRGMSRWQILIKGTELDIIKEELGRMMRGKNDRKINISVDVDPTDLG